MESQNLTQRKKETTERIYLYLRPKGSYTQHVRKYPIILGIRGKKLGIFSVTMILASLAWFVVYVNVINEKSAIFYIEAIPQLFFSTSKKYFFRARRKKSGKFLKFFWKMKKVKNFNEKSYMIFHWKIDFFIFQKNLQKKSEIFFELEKILFFSKLKKKLGYSFDVEQSHLSIYEVFSTFPAP